MSQRRCTGGPLGEVVWNFSPDGSASWERGDRLWRVYQEEEGNKRWKASWKPTRNYEGGSELAKRNIGGPLSTEGLFPRRAWFYSCDSAMAAVERRVVKLEKKKSDGRRA